MLPLKEGIDFHAFLECSEIFKSGSALDHLAATLFVNRRNPGACLMAMFTAYFDCSGNAVDQPFVVVSGYIANYYQWQLFENSWKAIHKEHGVNPPFHMAEFYAATSNLKYQHQKNARQDYIDIAKDNEKATTFFKQLCTAQLGLLTCGVSCIVPMSVYEGVSSLLSLREVVPPYALAARMCMERIHRWEDEFDIQDRPIECIFEEGDFEQGKFTELMIADGMDAPIYKKKEAFAGLQAADQYAWEQTYFLKQELRGTHLPARGAFTVLLNAIPKLHIQPTQTSLINLCHAKGIDPRTGIKHDKK